MNKSYILLLVVITFSTVQSSWFEKESTTQASWFGDKSTTQSSWLDQFGKESTTKSAWFGKNSRRLSRWFGTSTTKSSWFRKDSTTPSSYVPNWSLPELPSIPELPNFPSFPSLPGFPSFPSWPTFTDLPNLPSLPKLPQPPFQNFTLSGSLPKLPEFVWFHTNISETSTVEPKEEDSWSLTSLSSSDMSNWFQDDDNAEEGFTDIALEAANETDWFQSYREAVRIPPDWIRRYETAVSSSASWIESYSRTLNGSDSWLDKYGSLLGINQQWIDKYRYAKTITDASIEKYQSAVNVTGVWYKNYKLAMQILNDTYRTVDWFVEYKDKLSQLNYTLLDENWLNTYTEALSLLQDGIPTAEVFDKYREAVKILNDAFGKECTNTTITCPNTMEETEVEVCCSSLWLSVGAPIGLGTECWMDLEQVEEGCSMYSCYRNKKEGNLTNLWNADGCSWVPDVMLNYESCVLHDLCYVTPNMTKADCDVAMMDNINKIYCDNVNIVEQAACQARASWANAILGFTDKYFMNCAWEREACSRRDLSSQIEGNSTGLILDKIPPRKFDDQPKPFEKCLPVSLDISVEERETVLERFMEASFCVLEQFKNETQFSRNIQRIKTGRKLKKMETTLLLKGHCDNANNNNSSMKKSCRNCFRDAFRRPSDINVNYINNINKAVTICSKTFLGEKYKNCTALLENRKKGEGKMVKTCFDRILMRGVVERCTPPNVTTADVESFKGVLECGKDTVYHWIDKNTSTKLATQLKLYFDYFNY